MPSMRLAQHRALILLPDQGLLRLLCSSCGRAEEVLRFMHPTNVEGEGPLGWMEEEKQAGKWSDLA